MTTILPKDTAERIRDYKEKFNGEVGYLSFEGHDPVNHPKHYTSHPSGVEVIQITEHMNFCLGNAVKYILRADLKNDAIEDLRKAEWYIKREIERRLNEQEKELQQRPVLTGGFIPGIAKDYLNSGGSI